MAPDWAEALAPVDDRVAAMGRFLGRRSRPDGPTCRPATRVPRVPPPVGRGPGTDRRPGPVPHARSPDRPLLRRRRARAADPAEPREHLPGARDRRRRHPAAARRPDRLDRAGRDAAQPRADRAARPAAPHRGKGWEHVTACAISAVVRRAQAGADRRDPLGPGRETLKPHLDPIPWVESAHPSPLSASRGFFGSRPFSRVNQLLAERGGDPVDWSLPME